MTLAEIVFQLAQVFWERRVPGQLSAGLVRMLQSERRRM